MTQLPGGGVVRFARAAVAVRVARGGAVLCGWDGAEAAPSRQLGAPMPEADPRAALEPDTQGGWRVVSERVTVGVSARGAVEIRTPGGALLRRDEPPRWWETAEAGHDSGRWVLRGQVAADARFLRAAGPVGEPSLPDGAYRVGESGRGGGRPPALAQPALVVTASAGTHLVWYDLAGEGVLAVRRGREGGGSGHDVPGGAQLRVGGGPLRYWVLVGAPERVLPGWAALVGPRVTQAGDDASGTLFRGGAGRL
ncbi:hypothetical protein ACFV3R_22275 [Streptomyces sp. NPDC059740]|uniref:hypothetical protein n=1 Tax=Streptomyces sp. NPDC059740 TaxID=3346926 RepID=UPI003647B17D